jgi:hypothetical protein
MEEGFLEENGNLIGLGIKVSSSCGKLTMHCN